MAKIKKFSKAKVIFQASKNSKALTVTKFSDRLFPIGQKKTTSKHHRFLPKKFFRDLDNYISLGVGLIIIFFLGRYVINNTKLPLQINLATAPLNVENNLNLANHLIEQRQFHQAELVLRFAEQQEMKNKVLGWNESNEDLLSQLWQKKHLEDPQDIQSLIDKWEVFEKQKPDYRDGYIQLSLLYQSLNDKSKAINNIDQALKIDPNNEIAQKIKSELEI